MFRRVAARQDGRTQVRDDISPLVPVNRDAEVRVVADYFAGVAARQSAEAVGHELSEIDVIMCDELDFGAMAAGARAGVPVVVVSVIASGALVRADLISDALEDLRQEIGLPEPIRYQGDLYVIPFARTMRDPVFPDPDDAGWMRPHVGHAPNPDGSIVATLGTEFNTESGDLFDRILDALAEIDAPSVVAVGRDIDPARFGPRPSQVRVEQYVDLGELIPRASVVLHHGGSGLFMSSVLGGAPQILFPMGADQPFTADQVQRLGVGMVLDPQTAASDVIREKVTAVTADTAMRDRIMALRIETLALPDPSELVKRVESLVHPSR